MRRGVLSPRCAQGARRRGVLPAPAGGRGHAAVARRAALPVRSATERARGGDDDADAVTDARTGWSFARVAPPLETRAIFELAWAPASWLAAAGPALAQADAGGFLTLTASTKAKARLPTEARRVPSRSSPPFSAAAGARHGDVRGVGERLLDARGFAARGGRRGRGLRVARVAETGDLRVTQEATDAHSLEAWAVAFATKDAFHGSGRDVVFSGADDAELKAWDVRAGLDAPAMRFRDWKTHGAGVTCVAPSPHDPHALATGSYDDVVRLWDARAANRPVAVASCRLGGGRGARGGTRARDGWRWRRWTAARSCWTGTGRSAFARSATKTSSKTAASPTTTQTKTRRTRFKSALPMFVPGLCVRPAFTTATRPSRTEPTGAGAGGRSRGDVVVSCSFYDKGLHVWTPTPRDVLRV